ncbi:MAG: dicarboxylate transporter protein DctQ subunit, partial [Betaproteobacteria bacterium]|nr:dicarboxylate transporter protein DctQ subunit [Betaproteobacteria bacterium]
CVICIRTGVWPERIKDVEEIDVVGEQLAQSEYVDEESRRAAILGAHDIEAAAHARGAERT